MKFSMTSRQMLILSTRLIICCEAAVASVGDSCTYDWNCGTNEECSYFNRCTCKSGYHQYGTSCSDVSTAELGTGIIIAIVFGILVPLVCCISLVWCLCRRRQPGVVVHSFASQPQPQAAQPIIVNTQFTPGATNYPVYTPQMNSPACTAPSNPCLPAYKY